MVKENIEVIDEKDEKIRKILHEAFMFWSNSDYNNAKEYAESALELAIQDKNKKREADASWLLGVIHSYLNSYDTAYNFHLKCLKINRELGRAFEQAEAWNNLGDINFKLGNFNKAKECFEKSLSLIPNFHRALTNLGYLAFTNKNYDEALFYYKQGKESALCRESSRSAVISLINQTEVYTEQKKFVEAEKCINEAYQILEKDKSISTVQELTIALELNKAIILFYTNKIPESFRLLNELLNQTKELQNKDYILKTHFQLSELYAKTEDFKNAYYHLSEYNKINTELLNQKVIDKVMQIQNFYEKEKQVLTGLQINEKTSKLATLGVLAAGITHEINQPLCAIKINVESIMYCLEKTPIALPFNFDAELNQTLESVDRITEIVKHMRSFWNYGKNAEISNIEVHKTILNTLSFLQRQIYSHEINIVKNFSEEDLFIKCASIHLEQILINIINNAISALDKSSKKDKEITIFTKKDKNTVLISIKDNGTGIPEDKIENLFDPFYSTHNSEENMGLGLAIVKYFTEHYKAKLDVKSEENNYTEFIIEFDKEVNNELDCD